MSTGRPRAAVSSALPDGLVRFAARTLRRGRAVSVVVVVTDDNAGFLADCVGALGAQERRRAEEILLVVTGTSPVTRRLVDEVLASSWRIARCDLPDRTASQALAHGAASASGALLLLIDAGDTVTEGALAALVDRLNAPEVELAVAEAAVPGRLQLGDMLVRSSLWRRLGATLPEGPHADWLTAARLMVSAAAVASIDGVVRTGERRGTGVAFGTMPVRAPSAAGWSDGVRRLLGALAGRSEHDPFLLWLLDEEAPAVLEDAERCTPEQWTVLATLAADLLAAAPPRMLQDLRVESRVRLWLAAHGRRRDLEQFNAARWLEDDQFPTRLSGEAVVADLAVDGGLPEEVLTLGQPESRLVTRLSRLRRRDTSAVEVEVLAYVRHLAADAAPGSRTLTLVGPQGHRTPLPVETDVDPHANLVAADRFCDQSAGVVRGLLNVPELLRTATPGDRWHLEVEVTIGALSRRGRVDEADLRGSAGAFPAQGSGELALRLSGDHEGRYLEAVATTSAPPPAVVADWSVTDLVIEGADALVTGSTVAPDGAGRSLVLHGPSTSEPVDVVVRDGRFECRLPLVGDRWGRGLSPLPGGTYRLQVRAASMPPARLKAGSELAASLPSTQSSALHRIRLQRGPDGALLVTLAAPLADDELGPFAQQQLQRWYVSGEHRVDPGAVYLQSYTGQSATDSPLAIHHALRRLRPDLSLHWAVADRATPVPEGARPLLLRSREWYDALATAGSIVTNIDMDRWFTKSPGQRLLQTFHGYPAKTMGIAAWEAKNFTPLRIEKLLRRTSGTWDLLLTPSPEMDVHYRREYRYDGEILAAGYPRDDILVGPDHERVREETRARLGVRVDQKAVLFAPTWRDDLATNFRAAPMSTDFDVQRAAHELGDGHVLLLRGHRFHRRRGDLGGARLLDVTDYPEINDLILASDVAVLDYSSLRFDFALTGRPMVFLVPDLGRYTGGVRGFLYDFVSTAPGPLVATTEEVVASLRDVDRLAGEHREQLARFNREFNSHQDGRSAERVVAAFFGPLA